MNFRLLVSNSNISKSQRAQIKGKEDADISIDGGPDEGGSFEEHKFSSNFPQMEKLNPTTPSAVSKEKNNCYLNGE